MKHILKRLVFTVCLLGIHNNASAGLFSKIRSYFTRTPPSTQTIAFPEITGPHTVGTTSYHWIDNNRLEKHAANKTAKRELMVQFWYPSTLQLRRTSPAIRVPQARFEKYQSDFLKKDLVDDGNSLDDFKGLDKIYSHAILQAPISPAQEKYPIVIFSHGFGMTRFAYSAHCEELASN